MAKNRRAVPADEIRSDDAGSTAVDKNQQTQAAESDSDAGFFDILGFGDPPKPEETRQAAADDDTQPGDGGEAGGEADGAAADEGGEAEASGEGEGNAEGGEGTEQVTKADKAKALLAKLTPILQKLTGAVEKAKDGKLAPDVASAIASVAKALRGMSGGGKEDEGEAEKTEKAAGGPLAAAVAKLTALVEAVKKAGDGDVPGNVPAQLATIAATLERFLSKQQDGGGKEKGKDDDGKGKTEKAFEVFKAAGAASDDPDPEIIIKAGAKMQRSRLSKLKAAVQTLAALVKELEGEAAGGEGDGKGAEDKVSKVDLSPVLSKIEEMGESIGKRVEALEGTVGQVTKRVDTIENTRPAGNGEGDPDPVQKSDDNLWAGIL